MLIALFLWYVGYPTFSQNNVVLEVGQEYNPNGDVKLFDEVGDEILLEATYKSIYGDYLRLGAFNATYNTAWKFVMTPLAYPTSYKHNS